MSPDDRHAIEVRAITAFDPAMLAELHAAIFRAPWDQPWSAQSFAEILAMPGAQGWLLGAGGVPAGFMLARFMRDEGEILLTGVVPQARRRGHAARMVGIVIDAARAAGVARLFLEHAAGNHAAAALYGRFGFAPVGRRRAYYERRGGGREDALTLRCELSPAEIPEESGPPA
jgi:ribosomal-protein-alanine N-acetyltransferase